MKKECDNFPAHNHKDCELDPCEASVASYFEARDFVVEKLCSVWLPQGEKSPDFRITDTKGLRCLCEVKGLAVSTGALAQSDWRYYHYTRIRRAKDAAEREGARLILRTEEMKLFKKEFPYPEEGRNTEKEEERYERTIRGALQASSVVNEPLQVLNCRDDPFIWTESERKKFEVWLIESLGSISRGTTPWNWNADALGSLLGTFAMKREDGRYVRNLVSVSRKEHPPLVFKSVHHLGINWEAVERERSKARKQIGDRLKREPEPDQVARLVVMLLTVDLADIYGFDIKELKAEIRRRIFSKFPELSAIAFCKTPFGDDDSLLPSPFRVFHNANASTPSLPRYVFDDGSSGQVVLSQEVGSSP